MAKNNTERNIPGIVMYSKKEYWQCFWSFFRPYLWKEIFAFVSVLASTLLGLTSPLLMGLLIDHALVKKDMHLVYIILGASMAVLIAQNIFIIFQEKLFGYISNRLGYDLRMALIEKLMERDVLFFHKKNVGELMSRILSEVRDVLSLFSTTILRVATEVFSFVGTIGVMVFLNLPLTLISCLSIPLVIITLKHYNPKLQQNNRKVMDAYVGSSNVLQENLQGISIFKHFRREGYGLLRFSKSLHKLIGFQMVGVNLRIWNMQILSYIYAVAPTVLIIYGGKMVIDGVMTMGAFVAFYSYLSRLYAPVRSLANINVELQQTMVAFYRFYDLLHTFDIADDGQEKVEVPRIKDRIDLENITFAYNDEQEKLLEQFSLTLRPGEIIGIVGRNGIGKSTLFGLLSGQYRPEVGEVRFDGVPLKQVKKGSLQQLLGVVPQDSYMFNVSLLENITLGRRGLSVAKVDELAKVLNIKEFVDTLPNKYDTIAEKNGENFSGGQKQKFGIIRALVHEPQILLLDEATSAIDVQTEEAFFEWLARNKGDKIILYISHKPHLLQYADRIIRFEGVNEVYVEDNDNKVAELIS